LRGRPFGAVPAPRGSRSRGRQAVTAPRRVGHYRTGIGLPWLGFALDGSYYALATSASDVDVRLEVAPISALAFLRLPLVTDPEVLTGRLQLYIGGGPSLIVRRMKLDASVIGERFSETTAELGARPPRGAHVHADPRLRGLRGGPLPLLQHGSRRSQLRRRPRHRDVPGPRWRDASLLGHRGCGRKSRVGVA